jgi:hypothetical protein
VWHKLCIGTLELDPIHEGVPMRLSALSQFATITCLGLAACGVTETLASEAASQAPARADYVSRTETTLTDFEIDLAKLELRLSKRCRADHACAFGAELAAVGDDLAQARSRLDELRAAPPPSWQRLRPGVDTAVITLRETLNCLRDRHPGVPGSLRCVHAMPRRVIV